MNTYKEATKVMLHETAELVLRPGIILTINYCLHLFPLIAVLYLCSDFS